MTTKTMNEEADAAEAEWPLTIPNVILEEDPQEAWLVKAHNIFAGKSFENLDALACRIADVCPGGVTKENFEAAKPLAGACKKFYANVEKLRTGLNRPILDWKKAVDTAAAEMVARAEPTLDPIINAVKDIEDARKAEKERLKNEREEAEKKAIIDAENARLEAERAAEAAKRAAEVEANRKEQERLLKEREAFEEEKKKIAAEAEAERLRLIAEWAEKAKQDRIEAEEQTKRDKAERDRLKAEQAKVAAEAVAVAEALVRKAKIEQDRLTDELNAKLAKERADQAEKDRVAAEAAKAQQDEMKRIEEELAQFRRAKFAAEQAERDRIAKAEASKAAKAREIAEAERKARMAPDVEKVHKFGGLVFALISDAPEVVSDEAAAILRRALMDLSGIAADLQRFGKAVDQ